MVGGSASFLGIVEEFKFGVVVLTNTAKVVDDMGVRILSELVRLKKEEQRDQNGLPTERPKTTWRTVPARRAGDYRTASSISSRPR